MKYKNKCNYRNLIVGLDTKIPLSNGSLSVPINFDNAATTPPLKSVMKSINYFSYWYSSIHRGLGYKSQFCSDFYERSKNTVAKFVNVNPSTNSIIYIKNTTEAINMLSSILCSKDEKSVVLSTEMEHHSNDLPWRDKYILDYIKIDKIGKLSLVDLEDKLKKYKGKVKLVTITGASNVSGYKNDIHRIASIVHKYNSKILVDGAQLVPHCMVDMKDDNSNYHIDYLAFSAHKMYAPFGTGVLIGPKSTFESNNPDYKGGGTVKLVTPNLIVWDNPPNKNEAGSPNIMGVVALVSSINTLSRIGMDNISSHEGNLTKYALNRLRKIKDVEIYTDSEIDYPKVGIISFNIKDMPHLMVSTILSLEAGIATRNGCFCAQPYSQQLLNVSVDEIESHKSNPSEVKYGMVRISFGFYNTFSEIDFFIECINHIIKNKNYYLSKYYPICK